MGNRIERLLHAIGGAAAFITKPENVRWLSGFTGEGALLVAPGKRVLVTDFRYQEIAALQAPAFTLSITDAQRPFAARCAEAAEGHVCVKAEFDHLTVKALKDIEEKAGGAAFEHLDGAPDALRAVKDEEEIACIKAAAAITDKAFTHMLGFIKPGLTEREIAAELFACQVRMGAEGIAFPTIAASGERSSLPHAEPSLRKIRQGDLLTLDFGCVVEGYRSDFTRTLAIGRLDGELRAVYQTVLDAQARALDALCAARTGKEVDAAARGYIYGKGYEGMFGHGLGHGVGLAIHEKPSLSALNDKPLEAGNVVTVEPGIYIKGRGGVRIEDLCVVTDEGHINMTASDKQLIII